MRNILPYGLGLAGKICWATCFHIYSSNIRLRNDRFSRQQKDLSNPVHGHNFMNHAKFTLLEQLTEISNVSKDTLRLRLKRR